LQVNVAEPSAFDLRPSAPYPPPSRTILGVRVDDVTADEALALCEAFIRDRRRAVVTPNPEIVMAARADRGLRHALARADLAIPDGGGLLLAARLWGRPLREQVRGTDLAYRLIERAATRGYRVFLLGAAPGVADEAARRLRARYPGLDIAGAYAGVADEAHDADTRAAVARAGPVDVLLVAYGASKQERWLARNLSALDVGVALGIGGVLDFMAGRVRRAPAPVRRAGFEWLYRLLVQPWRWRRQLRAARYFPLVALRAPAERSRE
jgi:N-acetylglucosaminyldiphosphoundecaprenol N-acetyl-beta-D-mannosaminyltransferase